MSERQAATRGIQPDVPGKSPFAGQQNSALTDEDMERHTLSLRFSELVAELHALGWPASKVATVIKAAGFTGGGAASKMAMEELGKVVEQAKRGDIPISEVPPGKPPW